MRVNKFGCSSIVIALGLFQAVLAGAYAAEPAGQVVELVSTAPENAAVYIISPKDGAVVTETFTVKFGLSGMGVAPAGIQMENTGHHHLLVDLDGSLDLSKPLPTSDTVRHFGKGQTETEVTLTPGTHRLKLLLGNYLHIPHNPPVTSEEITVTVVPSKY